MDLENKLIEFPHVYYFNMDNEMSRRRYMEDQFDIYDIEYTRISGDRFKASNIKEWIDVLKSPEDVLEINSSYAIANTVNHLIFLKEWYKNSNEQMIVLMEDDYDLTLIDHWHFDWKYLMSKLPFDWDTVQLGYEHFERVEFFLSHKDYRSFNFGPTLINRNHIKKILDLCFDNNDKIVVHGHPCYGLPENKFSVDYLINHIGKNYTIPIITTNTDFFQDIKDIHSQNVYDKHRTNRYIYHYWWKNKRDNFDLEDFFRMNKENDNEMTEYLHNYVSRALSF